MIGIAAYTWLMPVAVALFTGAWAGWRHEVAGPRALLRLVSLTALVAATVVYAGHMLWLAALVRAAAAEESVAVWSLYWTGFTALIWFPVMVIALLGAATIRRRQA